MANHEFGYPKNTSETEDTSWDITEIEPATDAEKATSRLGARGLFEQGVIDGKSVESLGSDALGIQASRMELSEGSSVTEVVHVGGPRAGTSETRLVLVDEGGRSQEIIFSQNPGGETTVMLGGEEATDRETLGQIDAVTEHLRGQMSEDALTVSAEQTPAAGSGQAEPSIIDRAGVMGSVRRSQAEYLAGGPGMASWKQPQEYPAVTWGAGSEAGLRDAYRFRRENAEASYATWQEQRKSGTEALSAVSSQGDVDGMIEGVENLLPQSADTQQAIERGSGDVESYLRDQGGSAEVANVDSADQLEKAVAEQINEDRGEDAYLAGVDTSELADRIRVRTAEARISEEVVRASGDVEDVVEAAAGAVEGEYVARMSREARIEDARGDVAAFFPESDEGDASTYRINKETSGAEKGATGEALQEVAHKSAEQAQGAVGEQGAEQQEQQRQQLRASFNSAFGAVVSSPAGNMLRRFGVDPKRVGEALQSGELEATGSMVRDLAEIAKNRNSAIYNQQVYPPGHRPRSQLEAAAMAEQEKLRTIAEQLLS